MLNEVFSSRQLDHMGKTQCHKKWQRNKAISIFFVPKLALFCKDKYLKEKAKNT